jgi:pimeloyl-ACP methyl ester carboxylesterase
MRSEVVSAQGLALRLWDHEGSGPVALFVHGYLDTGRSFDEIARALAEDPDRVHALALDLRGHGQSERAGAGASYHLLDHVKDLACVLRALKERGTPVDALVGHSMGANVALILAGAAPALVKRLVLIDSFGPPPEEPEEQPVRIGELVMSVLEPKKPFSRAASREDAAQKIRAQNLGLSIEAARRMVEHALVQEEDGSFSFPYDARLRGPSPIRYPESMWLSLCARVTAPTVIVRASDGYVPEGETLDARLRALRATLVQLEGPHHLHVEKPAEVAAIVRQHLTVAITE